MPFDSELCCGNKNYIPTKPKYFLQVVWKNVGRRVQCSQLQLTLEVNNNQQLQIPPPGETGETGKLEDQELHDILHLYKLLNVG